MQTTGVGGQVVQGVDLNYISIVFQCFSCQWVKPLLTNVNNKMVIFKGFPSSNCELHSKIEGGILIEIWYDGAGFYFDATRRSGGELWATVCFDKFRAIDTNWLPL